MFTAGSAGVQGLGFKGLGRKDSDMRALISRIGLNENISRNPKP